MILVIDNYDSFTYNLVQYLGELGARLKVFRNDKVTIRHAEDLNPAEIVISPGPGRPEETGISKELIRSFASRVPILGVCLGHQCIAEAFGARIVKAKRLMHGKTSTIYHDGKRVYRGLPNPFIAIRYHSLIIEPKSLPGCFLVSARTKEGEIMGIRHKRYKRVEGVQFHPESILTDVGKKLLLNFLKA